MLIWCSRNISYYQGWNRFSCLICFVETIYLFQRTFNWNRFFFTNIFTVSHCPFIYM